MVANADQLVIVSALADPPPRTGFIDRCLVAAYDADIEPLLCLTKADLAGPERGAGLLRRAGPAVRAGAGRTATSTELRDRAGRAGLGAGRPLRRGQVHAGQPPGAGRAAGRSAWSARSARAGTPPPARSRCGCPVAGARRSGWIIDTPGIRSFGLAHVSAGRPAARLPRPGRGHGRTARPTATTRRRTSTAGWTPGSPPARPTRAGWRRSAGCWPPAPASPTRATERHRSSRPMRNGQGDHDSRSRRWAGSASVRPWPVTPMTSPSPTCSPTRPTPSRWPGSGRSTCRSRPSPT